MSNRNNGNKIAINLGITGHRPQPEKLPASVIPLVKLKISKTIKDFYKNIQQACNEISKDNPSIKISPHLKICSALAEGIDRYCVDPEIVEIPFDLFCILPFSIKEYAADFQTQESKKEYFNFLRNAGYKSNKSSIIQLKGNRNNSTEAYNNCGLALLEHSNIMLAVYNGEKEGKNGTSFVVEEAKKRKIPIIWINSLQPENRKIITKGDKYQKYSQNRIFSIIKEFFK